MFIRSPLWAGLLRSTGSGFDAALVQEERVGAWPLNHYDAVQRGRFSGIARDEIFTYHPAGWTAVLTPSASGSGLALAVTAAGFRSLSAR